VTIVGTRHRFENILPPLIHVVFGADADRFDEFLRTDDVFDRMTKLFSQLAMSDKHKSDHDITAPSGVCKRWAQYRNAAIASTVGAHLGDEKPKCKTKIRLYGPDLLI
jgi:hypothetical protein